MLRFLEQPMITPMPATTAQQPSSPPPARRSLLGLCDLHAGYGKKEILRGVSLTVGAGEIVTLLGANGAGKSTLLKAAMGLLPLRAGSVLYEGRNIARLPIYRRARLGISYFLQGGQVFPNLTVRENLEIGALVTPQEERAAALDAALETFPLLREHSSRRAGLLSGGQRQALALAMTLAQQPKILLLDEPSAGLSPKLAQEMLHAIQTRNAQRGLTVVLVEQRVQDALAIADRAIMLVNGVIAAETTHPEQWRVEGALDSYFFAKPSHTT